MPGRLWAATALVACGFLGLAARGADMPGLQVRRSGPVGVATFVTPATAGGAIAVNALRGPQKFPGEAFWDQYGGLFGINDADAQLALESADVDPLARVHTTYQQVHQGVPVFSGVLKLHQSAPGDVLAANGRFYPIKPWLGVTPSVDEGKAQAAAMQALDEPCRPIVEESELVIVDPAWYGGVPRGASLAYRIILTDLEAGVRESLFVDAHTGEVFDHWSLIERLLFRQVYDGQQGATVPGVLSRVEGGAPLADNEINRAYDFAGDFYNYLSRAFGRDSIDNAGFPLVQTVNSRSTGCPNAYWNGMQAVYCTGVVTDDIVAHELCHGLTDRTAKLLYQNQSGQLNESFSDVFGELVDLFNGNASDAGVPGGVAWPDPSLSGSGTDTPNNLRTACSPRPSHPNGVRWCIGEDSAGFNGALRDMAMPTCLNDPDRANSPLMTCDPLDGGGVHHGSGVPNKAFTLVVDGGAFNGRTITGIGAIKAGAIWYRALTVYLTPASDFKDAYDALVQSAQDLVGTTPNDPRTGAPSASVITADDVQQVVEALQAVELNTDGLCGQTDNVLDDAPPLECADASILFAESFESGAPGWAVSNSAPPTPYDWVLTTTPLPFGRPGVAMYCADPSIGDCGTQSEVGVHRLDSPVIAVPAGTDKVMLAFTHYAALEGRFDGGRVEISVGGGAWVPITRQSFEYNPYNSTLISATYGNSSPLAGSDVFSGRGGRWGRSLVNLTGYGVAGQNIQLRWVFSKDGCVGDLGWFLDDVAVYQCPDCDGDTVADIDQFVYRRCTPTFTTIGWLNPQTAVLPPVPPADGPVKLDFFAIGDFSGADEYLRIFVNDVDLGIVYQVAGIDCSSTPLRASISVPAATWNSAAGAGPVNILMTSSAATAAVMCNGTQVAMAVSYTLAAPDSNGNGVLDTCDAPIITQAPQSQSVVDGEVASFSVTSIGQVPLLYQWRRAGEPLADGPSLGGGTIAGATEATLTITGAGLADAGAYDVVVANPRGATPSTEAMLTVTPACPTIGADPQPITIDAGQSAMFTVTTGSGTAPFTYRWRRDGVDLTDGPSAGGGTLSGATTDALTLTAAGYYDAASFDCVVTNGCGSATSAAASLTVNAVCPIVTQPPQPQTVVDGQSAVFTASAIGVSPFTYQWRLDGVDLADGPAAGGGVISGATTDTLTITGASFADIGTGAIGYDIVISNSCGSATSAGATLTINPACPSIADQPEPLTIDEDQVAVFSVVAGGTPPFAYQWRRNGADLADGLSIAGGTIVGATTDTLTITTAGYFDSADYDCVVTNACGSATSDVAALVVNAICPIITQQPQPQTATDGGDVTLTATVIGEGPFAYQWRVNTVDLADGPSAGGGTVSGATSALLTITGAGMLDAGAYDVVITNACGVVTSDTVTLTMNPACPTVTSEPSPVAIDAGQDAVFSVIASGTPMLGYQWRRNGLDLVDGPSFDGGTISGATTDTLTITGAGYYDAGTFDCLITNACGGTATGVAVLTVNPICPVITQQPLPQSVIDGGSVTMTVTVVGESTLSYQWRLAGQRIDDGPTPGGGTYIGATTGSFTIAGVTPTDAGQYDVVVFNTCGSVNSESITLTVDPACPTITMQPQPLAIDAGQDAVFAIAAGGTAPLAYQWRRNGADLADGPSAGGGTIAGAATDTLSISMAGYFDAAEFDCVVSNGCGVPTTSSAAALVVSPVCPVITGQPAAQSVTDGDDVTFTVTAVGQATLAYQWRRGGVDLVDGPGAGGGIISGANSNTLLITGAGLGDGGPGDYDVVVSNTCGSSPSHAVTLTVAPACPAVTTPPASVTVDAGLNAVFTVVAGGTPPFTYQWRRAGADVVDGPTPGGGTFSGATTDTLTITGVDYPDAGEFDVVITNDCGSRTSPVATLTVTNSCAADFNESGIVSVQDIFDFLAAYFANDPRTDFNSSGVISVQDIFDYLAAYFGGCP